MNNLPGSALSTQHSSLPSPVGCDWLVWPHGVELFHSRRSAVHSVLSSGTQHSALSTQLSGVRALGLEDWFPAKKQFHITDRVAVIPVEGVLDRNLAKVDKLYFGMCDYADVGNDIMRAVNDPAVRAILLDLDSPGGRASGCLELASLIAQAGESKRIGAYVNPMACSACYFLAASAGFIYAPPSAYVGSIGTIATIMVWSGYLEQMGIKAEILQSGTLKAAGNPYREMSPEEKASLQGIVDEFGSQFRDFVHQYRPQIAIESMQGQCFLGTQAVGAGIIDSVTTFDQALADLRTLAK